MEDIIITTATTDDIDGLVDMRVAYIAEEFEGITEEEEAIMRNQLPSYFEKELGKNCIAFVAKHGDEIVSCAVLVISERPATPTLPNGMLAEVLSVYTKPEYRRQGICTEIMRELVKYGEENGLDRIRLNATDMGYSIYKKVGFFDEATDYSSMRYNIKHESDSSEN